MSRATLPDTLWTVGRSTGEPLVLRWLIVIGGAVALAATSAADGDLIPGLMVFAAGLVVWSSFVPDSHTPLVASTVIGLHWIIAVDDVTTPWSIVAGVGLAVIHIAASAVSVTGSAARWTEAMRRRWLRRTSLVLLAAVPTWFGVVALDSVSVGPSGLLVGLALAFVAGGVAWAIGPRSG